MKGNRSSGFYEDPVEDIGMRMTSKVALASSSLETDVVNGTDVKNAPVIIKPVEALCMPAYSHSNKPAIGHDGKEGHDADEGILFRPFKDQQLS